jgi:hypothetical protein
MKLIQLLELAENNLKQAIVSTFRDRQPIMREHSKIQTYI